MSCDIGTVDFHAILMRILRYITHLLTYLLSDVGVWQAGMSLMIIFGVAFVVVLYVAISILFAINIRRSVSQSISQNLSLNSGSTIVVHVQFCRLLYDLSSRRQKTSPELWLYPTN